MTFSVQTNVRNGRILIILITLLDVCFLVGAAAVLTASLGVNRSYIVASPHSNPPLSKESHFCWGNLVCGVSVSGLGVGYPITTHEYHSTPDSGN